MNDLISRQAVLKLLSTMPLEEAMTKALLSQSVKQMDAAQSEQRWIPCSESLPLTEYGESDRVLTTCGYRDVEDTSIRWINTLYFNGGCWCYPTGETYTQKVYAWAPLPEPWEGEENGKIN